MLGLLCCVVMVAIESLMLLCKDAKPMPLFVPPQTVQTVAMAKLRNLMVRDSIPVCDTTPNIEVCLRRVVALLDVQSAPAVGHAGARCESDIASWCWQGARRLPFIVGCEVGVSKRPTYAFCGQMTGVPDHDAWHESWFASQRADASDICPDMSALNRLGEFFLRLGKAFQACRCRVQTCGVDGKADGGDGEYPSKSGKPERILSDRLIRLVFFFCGMVGTAVHIWGWALVNQGRRRRGLLLLSGGFLLAFGGPLSLSFRVWPFN